MAASTKPADNPHHAAKGMFNAGPAERCSHPSVLRRVTMVACKSGSPRQRPAPQVSGEPPEAHVGAPLEGEYAPKQGGGREVVHVETFQSQRVACRAGEAEGGRAGHREMGGGQALDRLVAGAVLIGAGGEGAV